MICGALGIYPSDSKIGSDQRSHRNGASFCHLLSIFFKNFLLNQTTQILSGVDPISTVGLTSWELARTLQAEWPAGEVVDCLCPGDVS